MKYDIDMPRFWKVTDSEKLKKIIDEKKLDVNHIDKHGTLPPIFWAAEFAEDPALIQVLLDYGADVNSYEDGCTPLGLAVSYNSNLEISKFLLDKGANINLPSDNQYNYLHYACRENPNPDIIKLLINRGCDIEATDNTKETPIFDAVLNDNIEILQTMIDVGANLFHLDQYGLNPLLTALWAEMPISHIRLLVDYGSDIHLSQDNGYTPLDVAHIRHHRRDTSNIIDFLKNKGAEHSPKYLKEMEESDD